MEKDRVRVIRMVVYEGNREWVEETVRGAIHGTKTIWNGNSRPSVEEEYCTITAVTVGEFAELLNKASEVEEIGLPTDKYPK